VWFAQWHEKTGYWAVTAMRTVFDKVTGYGPNMNEKKWLVRIVFLETVAGVPGMVGGMVRAPLCALIFIVAVLAVVS
jgi:threonyl-tRNA synthetase